MGIRLGAVGGQQIGRDHLPVIFRPYGFDDEPPSVAQPYTRFLAHDWLAAVVVDDEDNPVSADWAENREDGTLFPFGFTPEEFLRYFIRVRTWRIEVSAGLKHARLIDPPPEDPPFYEWFTGSMSFAFDYRFAVYNPLTNEYLIPQKESDMIRARGREYLGINVYNDGASTSSRGNEDLSSSPDPLIENVTSSISAGFVGNADGITAAFALLRQCGVPISFAGNGMGFPATSQDFPFGGWIDDKWWPPIELVLGISGGEEIPGAGTTWDGRGDFAPWEGSGVFTFDGKTSTIKVADIPSTPDDDPGFIGYTSVTATITPKKWWPFAKLDGSPAFDEDTGDPVPD